jgi:hypothetical protein
MVCLVFAHSAHGGASATFSGGDGSEASPYKIATPADLDGIRTAPAAHFVQVADIDLGFDPWSTGEGWVPIPGFTGTYNGRGHIIKNLTINRTAADEQGLFGSISSPAVISDVGLVKVSIQGKNMVGALVGVNSPNPTAGAVKRCFSNGTVSGGNSVGGLIGEMMVLGTVEDCYSVAGVIGGNNVGGLIGWVYWGNYDHTRRCFAAGPVSGTGSDVGGLTGLAVNNDPPADRSSFWDFQTSGQPGCDLESETCNIDGLPRTTAQMMTKSNFTDKGWQFDPPAVWGIEEGSSYPYLLSGAPSGELLANPSFGHAGGVGWKTAPEADRSAMFANPGEADLHVSGYTGKLLWQDLDIPDVAGHVFEIRADFSAGFFPPGQSTAVFIEYQAAGGQTEHVVVIQPENDGIVVKPDRPATSFRERIVLPNDAVKLTGFGIDRTGSGMFYAERLSLTQVDVQVISTIEELQSIGADPAMPLDGYYVLGGDIDASATATWNGGEGFEPIKSVFSGTLDGRGHVIRNLFINRPTLEYVGIFQVIDEGGEVRNLTVSESSFKGYVSAGSIVGYAGAGSWIENCHANATVAGEHAAGVIAGTLDGQIQGSSSSGSANSSQFAGGLVGSLYGTIRRSYSMASVSNAWSPTSTWSASGGLAGESMGGTIEECFTSGSVNGDHGDYGLVGGLVGFEIDGMITNSYSASPVTGDYSGGLVGAKEYGSIVDSYARGLVSGSEQGGGLMGQDVMGGITVLHSYWDETSTGQSSSCGYGTPLPTASMTFPHSGAYDGWDFTDIWATDQDAERNGGYPYLKRANPFGAQPAEQTIAAFGPIPGKTFGVVPFAIAIPEASSGLPVSVTVKSGPASISGNVVTILGAGSVTLAANQPGNSQFLPAEEVTTGFAVAKADQVVSFPAPANQVYGPGKTFSLSATAPGGAVTFASSNTAVVTISGNVATIRGAGSVTITARQAGNANYKPVSRTRTVRIAKADQTITFPAPPNQTFAPKQTFRLKAKAPGGKVAFSSDNAAVIRIKGNTATLVGKGVATITARQSGNTNYKSAKPVPRKVRVR